MNQNIKTFYDKSLAHNNIANELYKEHNVKKGLRNENGTGVRVGLTKIADVVGYEYDGDKKVDAEGKLFYRGYELRDIINQRDWKKPYGYEEICFLLLFGYLPSVKELHDFCEYLKEQYFLPVGFLEKQFLHAPGKNLMNRLQQGVLGLYDYDMNSDDNSIENTLIQGLSILAKLPSIVCYAYQSRMHYHFHKSLVIHKAQPNLSIAENILYMMREDHEFTHQEALVLDLLLIVHADHGGGNNSTFTNVVIASTGTDIYSSIVGAMGSLKGPKHGGANLQVSGQMKEVLKEIGYSEDEEALCHIIERLLNKDFYDYAGLVYGMGHAIYTLSDPRSEVLKNQIAILAKQKGFEKEYEFYLRFERCAKKVILEKKGINVTSNVDFFSGFVYDMLQIPQDLYTPLFSLSRMVGWLAHNIENKLYDGRIVRPATKYVGEVLKYKKMEERK